MSNQTLVNRIQVGDTLIVNDITTIHQGFTRNNLSEQRVVLGQPLTISEITDFGNYKFREIRGIHHRNLFNRANAETARTTTPPPRVPIITWRFEIGNINDNNMIKYIRFINFTDNVENTIHAISRTLNVASSHISCGVFQVNNMCTLESLFTTEVPHELIKEAIVECLDVISQEHNNCPFLLMSNNENSPIINTYFDEICEVSTSWRRNHNSGNNIKIWCYYRPEIDNGEENN